MEAYVRWLRLCDSLPNIGKEEAMNASKGLELAVVMPIYNEAANISCVLCEWLYVLEKTGVRFELLALNDGSRDATHEILKELAQNHSGKIIVVNKPNSGHGRSCRYGYELALNSPAQWVLQIDSDGQCDPDYFPTFWSRRADADCVFGIRRTRGDGVARKLISKACGALSSLVAGVNVKDANVPYRLMRKTALAQALAKVPPDFDVQNIALTVALKRCPGLRWQYVPIHFRDRQGGVNSINLPKIVRMGWTMLGELRKVQP
ncbi:MAG: glycosyltransferase family 2 protein [Verrucomicrobiota bacterium]